MKPNIILPQLPDVTDPQALKEYLAAHQKILSDKQKEDYENINTLDRKNPFPVGSWYTQYPHVKSNDFATAFPSSQEPANKFGGTWTEPFAGYYCYFRTTGSEPDYYDSAGLIANRSNGLANDRVQRQYGYFQTGTSDFGYFTYNEYMCRLNGYSSKRPSGSTAQGTYVGIIIDNVYSPSVRTTAGYAGNTDVRHFLCRVWYRES